MPWVYFFYLKKASGVSSHNILLMKLKNLGINGTELEWFSSFLQIQKNKRQFETIQKKVIRAVTNSRHNIHSAPLLKNSKTLPYDKIFYRGNFNLCTALSMDMRHLPSVVSGL
jgi:hypothetical protein